MAKSKDGLEVNKGDKIKIRAQGINVSGTVVSVDYYGEDGWQIELTDANVPGGYSSWKQREDGGDIIEVSKKKN
jgi:hypothetical protein